jgi:NADP-dependent 3-hydroxy acid dehydrogenase YdfG
MNLKGKIILITGASAGIGEACAHKFAELGSNLILFARRMEKLDNLAQKIRKDYGVKVLTRMVNVRSFDEVKTTVDHLPEEWRDIYGLVNNAGKALGMSKIQEGDLDDWEEMIDTNVKGLLYVSRCVLPGMVDRHKGHIINIGSLAGQEVYPMGNVYCGTKSFVRAVSRGMIIDLNGTGVRVTNVDPGLAETEFSIVRFHGDEDRAGGVYKGYTPLTGEDVADTVIYAATRPEHVQIQEIFLTPTDQATATIINKKLI